MKDPSSIMCIFLNSFFKGFYHGHLETFDPIITKTTKLRTPTSSKYQDPRKVHFVQGRNNTINGTEKCVSTRMHFMYFINLLKWMNMVI